MKWCRVYGILYFKVTTGNRDIVPDSLATIARTPTTTESRRVEARRTIDWGVVS